MLKFSLDEYLSLSIGLEKHHCLFHHLWNWGRPVFSNETLTAQVSFNSTGECINFILNPDFWAKKTFNQKMFIIAHECLHIVLNHGLRIQSCVNKDWAGQTIDIATNHILIERFGFIRSEVDPENQLCWVDTVFPILCNLPTDKCFEYY